MYKDKLDDTFLARWIAEDLSPEELTAFKKHPDFKGYEKLQQVSGALSFSGYDTDVAFTSLKTKLTVKKKTKVRSLYTWISAAAACLVLTAGLVFYSTDNLNYATTIAEQSLVKLPDGSEMVLNASATAKVNSDTWEANRAVDLEGEAFFKVKKGSAFTVETSIGAVTVLGTQFTVNTLQNDLLVVKCFEGKVRVSSPAGKVVLTKGKAFQVYGKVTTQWDFDAVEPSWIRANETQFTKVPMSHVITSLKRHYKLKINNETFLDKDVMFTGSFTNKNLEKALYTVFGTLGVSYELVSENEIRILP